MVGNRRSDIGSGQGWVLGRYCCGSCAAAFTWRRLYRRRADAPKVTAPARCLTRIAALLAGPKRAELRTEWASHLSGETGTGLPSRRQARDALGFVASAIRCRCSDAADAAWTPVDAVLKSRALSNLFALMPTGLAALILFRHGGTIGLLGSAESVSAIYLALYALVLAGRKYRDVKPPEPKARRAKELLPGSARNRSSHHAASCMKKVRERPPHSSRTPARTTRPSTDYAPLRGTWSRGNYRADQVVCRLLVSVA
jgi:hypothetical protein